MGKASLRKFGEQMIGLGWIWYFGFGGTVEGIAVVLGVIQFVQGKTPVVFGDLPSTFRILLEYGLVVGFVICIIAVIFKIVVYIIGNTLIRISGFKLPRKNAPANLSFDANVVSFQDRSDMFVTVTNNEKHFDCLQIRSESHFFDGLKDIDPRIKWVTNSGNKGNPNIPRKEKGVLFWATLILAENRLSFHHVNGDESRVIEKYPSRFPLDIVGTTSRYFGLEKSVTFPMWVDVNRYMLGEEDVVSVGIVRRD